MHPEGSGGLNPPEHRDTDAESPSGYERLFMNFFISDDVRFLLWAPNYRSRNIHNTVIIS